jgi:hypothetical protein
MKHMSRSAKFGFGIVVAGLTAYGIAKGASSASLQWNPNPDPAVTGYNVYYGGMTRTYTNRLSLGNVTNATVGGLMEGRTYFFAVTASDVLGNESDFSDETTYIVPGFLVLTPGTRPGDPIRVQFPVAPAHWYELQVSGDLRSWTTVWQTMGVSNTWVEFDAPVATTGAQFYRLVLH